MKFRNLSEMSVKSLYSRLLVQKKTGLTGKSELGSAGNTYNYIPNIFKNSSL
ncbi:hypothetical protein SAMN05660293_01553 [Dyadobacter psychrophilus]|uniref:Uncharacterized protein n=1 Tax=Dyadobacter psychrophilus TaxID=651661 RepID=A0A1T5DE32_9BACT|nr:hypothetical protein SAMN05660293_01553 [Dyadobacter psychrophilus]